MEGLYSPPRSPHLAVAATEIGLTHCARLRYGITALTILEYEVCACPRVSPLHFTSCLTDTAMSCHVISRVDVACYRYRHAPCSIMHLAYSDSNSATPITAEKAVRLHNSSTSRRLTAPTFQPRHFHHFNTPTSTATFTIDLLALFSPADMSDHSAMLDLPQSYPWLSRLSHVSLWWHGTLPLVLKSV
jgi:hypothetical protein